MSKEEHPCIAKAHARIAEHCRCDFTVRPGIHATVKEAILEEQLADAQRVIEAYKLNAECKEKTLIEALSKHEAIGRAFLSWESAATGLLFTELRRVFGSRVKPKGAE